MSLPKVRNLGQYGVITDPDPYDLPVQAFSMGINARFRNGKITRGPVFRNVINLGTANPRYIAGSLPSSGLDLVFLGYENGTVTKFSNGAEAAYSISGYTPSLVEATWSDCHLADVFYINRSDRAPWALVPGASQFATLANWPASTTCQLLRSYGGALVALNVVESGTLYPNLVRTSSFAAAESVPSSWDYTTTSTNSTRNILAEMEGPITDAARLGQALIIYGYQEAWQMVADGSSAVYSYAKLPFAKGAINANCSIQIGSRHYVFGPTDIWVHDSISERSICEGKVRDFIYRSINSSYYNRCFVAYNEKLLELTFCFVSGDPYTAFSSAYNTGCNRSATYSITEDKWTFDDLPYVYFAERANVNTSTTWANVLGTWTIIGGSWADLGGSFKRVLCFVGDTNSTYSLTKSLYAFDPPSPDSVVAFPVDTNATKGLYLERNGLDLDELDADLQGYKQINYIIPQGRIDAASTTTVDFALGAADYFSQTATFGPYVGWDGEANYKIDFNGAGRYLFLKIRFNDYKYVSLSGYDIDLQITGER